jgi:hypothetical protein
MHHPTLYMYTNPCILLAIPPLWDSSIFHASHQECKKSLGRSVYYKCASNLVYVVHRMLKVTYTKGYAPWYILSRMRRRPCLRPVTKDLLQESTTSLAFLRDPGLLWGDMVEVWSPLSLSSRHPSLASVISFLLPALLSLLHCPFSVTL